MPISVPQIVERAWRDVRPGRKAACQNEILRELRRLLQHSCRVDGGSSRASVSIHGLGYLLTALRRQRLIPDELVLQLATFLRSHDLFLELRVRTPRTLTANQARHGGKQGTDGRERSRIHFRCLALNFTAAEPPAQRLTTSLTSGPFWSGRRCRGLRGRVPISHDNLLWGCRTVRYNARVQRSPPRARLGIKNQEFLPSERVLRCPHDA
jgi:hypothetical protein